MSLGDVFSDVDVDTLQVAASGLPNWVTFQYVTTQSPPVIRISGNVPFDAVDGQNYNVVLTATDPSGASVSTTLVVRDSSAAPTALCGTSSPDGIVRVATRPSVSASGCR